MVDFAPLFPLLSANLRHTAHLYVHNDLHNKQRLFTATELTGWYLQGKRTVFSRIKNVRFKQYVDGLWVSPRMSGFYPRLVHVSFVVGEKAQGYFHSVVRFC